jgi:hypothetical protein
MPAAPSRFALLTAVALAAAPGLAAAQDHARARPADRLARSGAYLLVGGGVTDLAEDEVKDRFDVGAAWDLRLGVRGAFLGAEAAYVGSVRNAVGAGAELMGHGAEAVLRLQAPLLTGRLAVEPFVFGGIGWSHLSLRDAAPGADDADDVGVVPFGAGVALGYGRLLLDARLTYRATFDEDLVLAAGEDAADLEQWGVTASVGYRF